MALYILSIFLSAFLIFQVQPMIARVILPWFGGTPAVWSTVMLFFQVLLTGGYAYASWLVGRVRASKQGVIHLSILGISLALVAALGFFWPSPITPGGDWKPVQLDWPIWQIFVLLMASVGLPYFILATNSPLTQAWFTRAFLGKSPYWLYALSNVGSLLALVTYPVLIEPMLTLQQQGWVWSGGYVLFALLAGFGAVRSARQAAREADQAGDLPHQAGVASPPVFTQILWLLLSAAASLALLAVTSQLTQEVAVIPFLWVLPLAVYLLSFVLAFSSAGWYRRPLFSVALAVLSVAVTWLLWDSRVGIALQIAIYSLFLFVFCMVAHGELYLLRPDPAFLTRFYLMVSLGGALGGILINFVMPLVFNSYWEFYIAWVLLWILLAVLTFVRPTTGLAGRWRFAHDVMVGAMALLVVCVSLLTIYQISGSDLYVERNFFGVLRVRFDEDSNAYRMVHGATVHGFQFIDASKHDMPTSYYWRGSGVGLALLNHPRYGQGMRVGVLGLGVGTLAAYGQPGDQYRFYEINPLVIDLAQGRGGYFSFLKDSKADVDVVLGDARISLEQELAAGKRQGFDLLVLDTFSSDSIPVHLITREAFALYLEHLAPDGIIATHITNRNLDLAPVLVQIARVFNLSLVMVDVKPEPGLSADGFPSRWMLLSRDPDLLSAPEILAHATPITQPASGLRLWTDDYSNLFQVLK
jgi:spermidine synthase